MGRSGLTRNAKPLNPCITGHRPVFGWYAFIELYSFGMLKLLTVPLLLLTFILASAQETDEIIIIVRKPAQPTAPPEPVSVVSPKQAARIKSLYEAVWHHPNQVFIDTDEGPMPLFTDVIYDAEGNPQPRFPDYFTYKLISDPNDSNARDYLAANAGRWRRLNETMMIMRDSSFKHGYIVPEDFETDLEDKTSAQNNVALYNPRAIHPKSRGAPVMTTTAARARGIKPEDIPRTPNPNAATNVEVVMIWDWRDEHSRSAMGAYAQFAANLRVTGLGIRSMGISVDNNASRVHSFINSWKAQFLPVDHVEYYFDVTNLIGKVGIRGTPTYLFFDRRSGNIVRLEGQQTIEDLQAGLMELIERPASDYQRIKPVWFGVAENSTDTSAIFEDAPLNQTDGPANFTPLPSLSPRAQENTP